MANTFNTYAATEFNSVQKVLRGAETLNTLTAIDSNELDRRWNIAWLEKKGERFVELDIPVREGLTPDDIHTHSVRNFCESISLEYLSLYQPTKDCHRVLEHPGNPPAPGLLRFFSAAKLKEQTTREYFDIPVVASTANVSQNLPEDTVASLVKASAFVFRTLVIVDCSNAIGVKQNISRIVAMTSEPGVYLVLTTVTDDNGTVVSVTPTLVADREGYAFRPAKHQTV